MVARLDEEQDLRKVVSLEVIIVPTEKELQPVNKGYPYSVAAYMDMPQWIYQGKVITDLTDENRRTGQGFGYAVGDFKLITSPSMNVDDLRRKYQVIEPMLRKLESHSKQDEKPVLYDVLGATKTQ